MIKMNTNKPAKIKTQLESRSDATTNYAGGQAFEPSDRLKLYTMVSSWLYNEPKFYADSDEEGAKLANNDKSIFEVLHRVIKADPLYVLQLAKFARQELYLRSAPTVLLVETALHGEFTVDKTIHEKSPIRLFTPQIIQRADELAGAVAYLQSKMGNIGNHTQKGSMPASLKYGLADAFKRFNEYNLAKYNADRMVKLRDVLRLVHPKPDNEEQSALWKRLKEGTMATPETWETIISAEGQKTTKNMKEAWSRASQVMPYMAMLRNLRNMLQNGVDMNPVIAKLTDENQVLKSKQFPYRFFSAYKQVLQFTESMDSQRVADACETALGLSVKNLPTFKGDTFITADSSGSMDAPISDKSTVLRSEIAMLLMAISQRFCERSMCSVFGETHEVVNMPASQGILSNMQRAAQTEVGHSTNAWLAFDYLLEKKIKVDRVIMFSDMQCYDVVSRGFGYYASTSVAEKLAQYRSSVNPDCFFYSVDLAGYGTLQVPESDPKTCVIAGWSEKLLSYIPVFESDKSDVLNKIQAIKP